MRLRSNLPAWIWPAWIWAAIAAGVLTAAAPVLRARPPEDVASDNQIASKVLHDLLASRLGQTLPQLPWQIVILPRWTANAYSNGRGRISITRGLAYTLGDHPGLWAAVVAHELGHVIAHAPASQPGFEAELRRAYQASGGSADDSAAERSLKVMPAASSVFDLRGERRSEYQADRLGLYLMAEAGFHPDFALALDRCMRATVGDQSKYSEFLLNHPLWSNREQQNAHTEMVTLAIFNERWPDASRSPGGEAPPLGRIQSVAMGQDPKSGTVVLRVSFEIRNVAGRQGRVAAILLDGRRKVRTSLAGYEAPDGTLDLNAMLPPLASGASEATLRIPAEAVQERGRKLKAAIFLVADDWTLDLWFQPVEFPPAS